MLETRRQRQATAAANTTDAERATTARSHGPHATLQLSFTAGATAATRAEQLLTATTREKNATRQLYSSQGSAMESADAARARANPPDGVLAVRVHALR